MNFLIPPNTSLFWLSLALCAPLIIASFIAAPWRLLWASQPRQHLVLACAVGLSLVWLFGVHVQNAVAFHPILITAITMVLGWSLTQLVGLAALLLMAAFQIAMRSTILDWDMAYSQFHPSTIPLDYCLNVAVPATWAYCAIALVNYWRFKNPFSYVLGVGFFGAMVGLLLIDLAALGLIYLVGSQAHWVLIKDHFWLFLLMTFPEGFINGTIATAFTIFLPDMVKTYKEAWFTRDGK